MSAYASGTHLVTNVHVEPLAVNSEVDLILLISQFRCGKVYQRHPMHL